MRIISIFSTSECSSSQQLQYKKSELVKIGSCAIEKKITSIKRNNFHSGDKFREILKSKYVEESGRFDTCLFIGTKIHYARSRFAAYRLVSTLCNLCKRNIFSLANRANVCAPRYRPTANKKIAFHSAPFLYLPFKFLRDSAV